MQRTAPNTLEMSLLGPDAEATPEAAATRDLQQ